MLVYTKIHRGTKEQRVVKQAETVVLIFKQAEKYFFDWGYSHGRQNHKDMTS